VGLSVGGSRFVIAAEDAIGIATHEMNGHGVTSGAGRDGRGAIRHRQYDGREGRIEA